MLALLKLVPFTLVGIVKGLVKAYRRHGKSTLSMRWMTPLEAKLFSLVTVERANVPLWAARRVTAGVLVRGTEAASIERLEPVASVWFPTSET